MSFRRTSWNKKIRLGLRNKKKQKWKRARGRHNKIRESIRGKLVKVKIGFKNKKQERGKINNKTPFIIRNMDDLKMIKKENIAIIGKMGIKKRREIETKLKELGAEVVK